MKNIFLLISISHNLPALVLIFKLWEASDLIVASFLGLIGLIAWNFPLVILWSITFGIKEFPNTADS